MKSYVGRVVMLKSGKKGLVLNETWESGPMLEIQLKNGKCIWLPDYEIVVL